MPLLHCQLSCRYATLTDCMTVVYLATRQVMRFTVVVLMYSRSKSHCLPVRMQKIHLQHLSVPNWVLDRNQIRRLACNSVTLCAYALEALLLKLSVRLLQTVIDSSKRAASISCTPADSLFNMAASHPDAGCLVQAQAASIELRPKAAFMDLIWEAAAQVCGQ